MSGKSSKDYHKRYYEQNKARIKEQQRNNYLANREQRIDAAREWKMANREAYLEQSRRVASRQRALRPDRPRARNAVNHALARGELTRMPCEKCGRLPSEAHHEDYSKPLEVKWLCRKHHKELHRKYK